VEVIFMDSETIKQFYELTKPFLSEKGRRLVIAQASLTMGRGGISEMSRITGMSRASIRNGVAELKNGPAAYEAGDIFADKRIRKSGAGRKRATETTLGLEADLSRLIDPATRGDPQSALLWTSKSTRKLAAELGALGHAVSYETVRVLLKEMGYSLQANYKNIEKNQHEDRNEQFEYIYETMKLTQGKGQPVISVDTKKKELVGNYLNSRCV
jgi:hypothetical protein